MRGIYSFLEEILRLIYPVRCPFCDEIVPRSQGRIHVVCRKECTFVQEPFCLKCGKQLKKEEQEYCSDCSNKQHEFLHGRSVLVYGKNIRHSIYRFKYGKRKEYAKAYAELTVQTLGNYMKDIGPDALIPVPLHYKRYQKRGYNQSLLLARELGKRTGVKVDNSLVKRVRNTVAQKNLNLIARQNNLKKAFKINKNDVKLNTIIIIDDIYTTGSTIDAIACICHEAGIQNIYFITLAGGE